MLTLIACLVASLQIVNAQVCTITLPNDVLSAKGLSTPFVVTGCDQTQFADFATFVEAGVLRANGQVFVYHPLIINKGQKFVPPVVPDIQPGDTVALWFGSNADTIALANKQMCVDGLNAGDNFGQVAFCNSDKFMAAAAAANLNIPALGQAADGKTCPTVRDFAVVDQDQSDNVVTTYLLTADKKTMQNTAANRQANPNAVVMANGSDNRLLAVALATILKCSPYQAPSLDDNMAMTGAQFLNELAAAKNQQAPIALIPPMDPMVTVNNQASAAKMKLYRSNVGQDPNAPADQNAYCTDLLGAVPRLAGQEQLFTGATSPDPGAAVDLFTFLAQRFAGAWTMLTCDVLLKMTPDQIVTLTMDNNNVTTAAKYVFNGTAAATNATANAGNAAGAAGNAVGGAGTAGGGQAGGQAGDAQADTGAAGGAGQAGAANTGGQAGATGGAGQPNAATAGGAGGQAGATGGAPAAAQTDAANTGGAGQPDAATAGGAGGQAAGTTAQNPAKKPKLRNRRGNKQRAAKNGTASGASATAQNPTPASNGTAAAVNGTQTTGPQATGSPAAATVPVANVQDAKTQGGAANATNVNGAKGQTGKVDAAQSGKNSTSGAVGGQQKPPCDQNKTGGNAQAATADDKAKVNGAQSAGNQTQSANGQNQAPSSKANGQVQDAQTKASIKTPKQTATAGQVQGTQSSKAASPTPKSSSAGAGQVQGTQASGQKTTSSTSTSSSAKASPTTQRSASPTTTGLYVKQV